MWEQYLDAFGVGSAFFCAPIIANKLAGKRGMAKPWRHVALFALGAYIAYGRIPRQIETSLKIDAVQQSRGLPATTRTSDQDLFRKYNQEKQ